MLKTKKLNLCILRTPSTIFSFCPYCTFYFQTMHCEEIFFFSQMEKKVPHFGVLSYGPSFLPSILLAKQFIRLTSRSGQGEAKSQKQQKMRYEARVFVLGSMRRMWGPWKISLANNSTINIVDFKPLDSGKQKGAVVLKKKKILNSLLQHIQKLLCSFFSIFMY